MATDDLQFGLGDSLRVDRIPQDVVLQHLFGCELVPGEDASHDAILFFHSDEHSTVDVMDEKGPESEHDQKMNFAHIMDTDQGGQPANEETKDFTAENVIVKRQPG